jgi:transmembrane sensor
MENSSKNIKHKFSGISFLKDVSTEDYLKGYSVPAFKDKEEIWFSVMGKTDHTPLKNKHIHFNYFFTIGSFIAAACLLLFFLYLKTPPETFINEQGVEYVHFLPDNSRVILAPGAQISYPKSFAKRVVKLKGTAYFEVEKGSTFSVKTGHGVVHVIGTRFLVTENDGKWMVSCYEGSVKVDYGKEERQLFSNQAVETNLHELKTTSSINGDYPELAYFKRTYNNQPIDAICHELETYFGIQIDIPLIHKGHFSGTFYNANPDTLLEILCTTFELSFKKTGKKQYKIISQDPI